MIKATATVVIFTCIALALPARAQSFSNVSCRIEQEDIILPPCVLEARGGHLFIARKFAKFLFSSSSDKRQAYVLGDNGWSWVDRSGRVLVTHVATMDNYANEFHKGLVRVQDHGKWGLADMTGKLVVPMIYDGMMDYEKNVGWAACTGCKETGDSTHEHHWFENGSWVKLDRYGKITG